MVSLFEPGIVVMEKAIQEQISAAHVPVTVRYLNVVPYFSQLIIPPSLFSSLAGFLPASGFLRISKLDFVAKKFVYADRMATCR